MMMEIQGMDPIFEVWGEKGCVGRKSREGKREERATVRGEVREVEC